MLDALIVGSSGDFIKTIEDVLLDLDYEVYFAYTSEEAESLVKDYPVDLIIMEDVISEGSSTISATDLCQSLKSQSISDKTLTIIASDNYSDKTRDRAFEAGSVAFFPKENISFDLRNFLKNVISMAKPIGYGKNPAVIVENDDFQRSHIKSLLNFAGIKSHDFKTGVEALDFLNENRPEIDIFILDYLIKDYTCAATLQQIKSIPAYQQIPVMITTAADSQSRKYELFLLGAADFISKPFDAGEFYLRLQNHLKTKHLMDMLEAKNKILAINATTDELTGLFNRRFFWECLKKESSRADRIKSDYSIIIMDIDDFKDVNDIYGHLNGDKVLSSIASIIKNGVRKTDTLARFGGEEFIVLLPDTSGKNAAVVADKLRKAVANKYFDFMKSNITLSMGVAGSDESNSFENVIQIADERLYKAKKNGKNQVVFD